MSKIIISDISEDGLRRILGKSREVSTSPDGTNKITFPQYGKLRETILATSREESGNTIRERTTLRLDIVDSNDLMEDFLLESVRTNIVYTDHFSNIQKLQDPTTVNTTDNSSFLSMYNYSTEFNYLAENYDNLTAVRGERQLPSVITKNSKQDFLEDYDQLLTIG